MPETWTYYIPIIVQHEGKIGFAARMVEINHALNSEEAVWDMIERLTIDLLGDRPEDVDALPVMPLGWTLVTAKRGSAVPPHKKKPRPKGNGHA